MLRGVQYVCSMILSLMLAMCMHMYVTMRKCLWTLGSKIYCYYSLDHSEHLRPLHNPQTPHCSEDIDECMFSKLCIHACTCMSLRMFNKLRRPISTYAESFMKFTDYGNVLACLCALRVCACTYCFGPFPTALKFGLPLPY